MKSNVFRRMSRGFTLVELITVVAIIVVLMILLLPKLLGNTNEARAALLTRTATSMVQNVKLITDRCGAGSQVAGNVIPAAGRSMADVLFEGENAVAASKKACYKQASVLPMRDSAARSGANWEVSGFPVTVTGGGTDKLTVAYAGVPDSVVLAAAQPYTSNLTELAASDTTSDVLRYSTSSGGTRTLSYLLAL